MILLLSILCDDIGLVSLLFQRPAKFYYCVYKLLLNLVFGLLLPSLYLHFSIQRIFINIDQGMYMLADIISFLILLQLPRFRLYYFALLSPFLPPSLPPPHYDYIHCIHDKILITKIRFNSFAGLHAIIATLPLGDPIVFHVRVRVAT